MDTAKRMGRLCALAVGLGIGAAVAATPGTASATTDFDISIDGMDVFNGGGTATATSGLGDMAIAFGPNSNAVAEGGFGDFASAFSTGSGGAFARAGDEAVGATGNNFDYASAFGNNSDALAGTPLGDFPDTIGSSFDFATAVGGNGAGAGALADAGENGTGDYASAVGENVESDAGFSHDAAAPANFDWASAWGNIFTPTSSFTDAISGGGGLELGGSNDLTFVIDPFGTVGSEALAGLGHNFDLAGALGDNLTATSFLADFLAHIAPLF
jgi:hypothetical protein